MFTNVLHCTLFWASFLHCKTSHGVSLNMYWNTVLPYGRTRRFWTKRVRIILVRLSPHHQLYTKLKSNFIDFLKKKNFFEINCYIIENIDTDAVKTCNFWDNIWCDEYLTCWEEIHLLTSSNVISFISVRFDYLTVVTVKSRPFIATSTF
jgi:hypothetical protein